MEIVNPAMETMAKDILIPIGSISLEGHLAIPEGATGIVVFSHGSGSSRFSRRNNQVADSINKEGLATMLFDLLTAEEDEVYEYRFDIDLLTNRMVSVTKWLMKNEDTRDLNIGFFGASTGAASALNASAIIGDHIKAVVSRGGRPDLSINYLDKVQSPVLLIVGSLDREVIRLNEIALNKLSGVKQLSIVQGATHLFEEPGKLEEVSKLSAEWFKEYL